MRTWLSPLRRVCPSPGARRPPRYRPILEGLENRSLPSVAPLPLAGGFANPRVGRSCT